MRQLDQRLFHLLEKVLSPMSLCQTAHGYSFNFGKEYAFDMRIELFVQNYDVAEPTHDGNPQRCFKAL